MIDILKKLWSLLTPKEKLITVALLVMMLISSALELLGIGLVMPVIALLAQPELIEQNKYLHAIYTFLNPASHNSFLITLCVMLIVLYICNCKLAKIFGFALFICSIIMNMIRNRSKGIKFTSIKSGVLHRFPPTT